MNPLLLLIGGGLVVALLVFLRTVRRTAPVVTWQDIPSVMAALAAAQADGNFAVFMFAAGPTPAPLADGLNLQVSIDHGVMGIDWVLISNLNLDGQTQFREFFERRGLQVISREGHGVQYLRVEGERLADLVQELLQQEFGVKPDQQMDLIAEGFTWPKST